MKKPKKQPCHGDQTMNNLIITILICALIAMSAFAIFRETTLENKIDNLRTQLADQAYMKLGRQYSGERIFFNNGYELIVKNGELYKYFIDLDFDTTVVGFWPLRDILIEVKQ